MKKRLLCTILVILLIAALPGCGGKTTGSETDTAPAVQTQEAIETEETTYVSDDLGDVTFDGKTYTVLYRDEEEHLREITALELTGDIINDAIYNRTMEIQERFDIILKTLPDDEGTLNNTFINAVSAGDRSFDIAFQHMIVTASLAAGGVTMNWYDIPHLNFEKPWWTSSVEELTVNDVMYITASDYCLNTFEMAWCLFFNKQMLENLHVQETPYELALDGRWTMDTYYDMVKDVSYDSDGDGSMTANDVYGINSTGDPARAAVSNYWWGCGESISRFDDTGKPYFAMETEKTQLVFEKMYALLVENDIAYQDTAQGQNMIFWNNKALFASMTVREVEACRDKDLSYGVVPYPKYDETQEKYLTLVDGHSSVMALPVTLTEEDRDFVGTMVEAFSAAAYNDVLPAYYETAIQTKFAQDDTMPQMLELVRQGRVFNFGYVYDIKINRDILVELIYAKKTNLASKIAAAKEATENYYEKVSQIFQ